MELSSRSDNISARSAAVCDEGYLVNDSGINANNVDALAESAAGVPSVSDMDTLAAGLSGALNAASKRDAPQELRFGFSCHGFYFTAKAKCREDGEARLSLCGSIGILPYSVQSAFVRRCVLYLMDEKRRPALGRFLVQSNKRILFLAETGISWDMNRDAVIAGVCRILFDAKPHLDLMAECLTFVPLSKTRPQLRIPAPDKAQPEEASAPDAGNVPALPVKDAAPKDRKPADEEKTSMKAVLSKVKAKDKEGLQVKKGKKTARKGTGKTKAKGKSGKAKKTAKKDSSL